MFKNRRILRPEYVATLAAFALILLSADIAQAGRKPEDVFSGQIITSKKRIPNTAKSANDYIKKLRKTKSTSFWEDKEDKEWRVYFAAFFKKPLNDLEVTVKFFDIGSGGPPKMIASFEQYLPKKGMRTFTSKAILERKFFGVNKYILMVIENRGRRLAMAKFKILGEGPKYKGTVDFTEDDEGEKKKKK